MSRDILKLLCNKCYKHYQPILSLFAPGISWNWARYISVFQTDTPSLIAIKLRYNGSQLRGGYKCKL